MKDKVQDKYCNNIVYYYNSKEEDNVNYTGETKCRLGKRIKEHQGSDKNSAIVLNFQAKDLPPPVPTEFSILAKNYAN